ncbi:poly(ADP-ribose) glycohydrolase ARH3 [Tetranychus urticae]|nr:poly(ADP-ribose) glycohydrolase ARH3 [Tetranychus urticae]
MNQLRSRFRGCLLGVHVGDTFGAPFENDEVISRKLLQNYLNNLVAGKSNNQIFPYTDDTLMTRAVAQSLVAHKGFNATDLAKRFAQDFFENPKRGYGERVTEVFAALHIEEYADPFGPAKRQFSGTGSYGNGAAMRIAPVALYGINLSDDKFNEMVDNCSRITHTNVKGVNGAKLQCHAIREALRASQPFDSLSYLQKLAQKMEKIEDGCQDKDKIYSKALLEMLQIFEGKHRNKDPLPADIADIFGNSVSAQRSVPSAVYSFVRAQAPTELFETDNPFLRALFLSISLGGDTDTIASMACAISGALHGDSKVPPLLIEHCEASDNTIKLADELHKIVDNQSESNEKR